MNLYSLDYNSITLVKGLISHGNIILLSLLQVIYLMTSSYEDQ